MGNFAENLKSQRRDVEAMELMQEQLQKTTPGPDHDEFARVVDEWQDNESRDDIM
jgi:hypothetical protein